MAEASGAAGNRAKMDLERNGRFQQIKPLRCDGREYLKPESADLKKHTCSLAFVSGSVKWVNEQL